MDTEQKGREAKRSGNSTEPTVAGDSMQAKPPGVQQAGGANVQSAKAEEGGGALRDRGTLQSGSGGIEQKQRAGAQESAVGSAGSRQSGNQASQARSGSGSKQSRYDDTVEGKQTRYDSSRNRGGD